MGSRLTAPLGPHAIKEPTRGPLGRPVRSRRASTVAADAESGPWQASRRTHRALTVLGVDPSETFFQTLSELCVASTAVTIEPRTGAPFDAVLLACSRSVLVYEHWSDALGMPTGDLGAVRVAEIDVVRVPY